MIINEVSEMLYSNSKWVDTERMSAEIIVLKELKNKLAHAAAVAERNGANTGIPTAATAINGKKHIPNTRRGSDKPKGGQPGHKRHTLAGFDESEITDVQEHHLDLSVEAYRNNRIKR